MSILIRLIGRISRDSAEYGFFAIRIIRIFESELHNGSSLNCPDSKADNNENIKIFFIINVDLVFDYTLKFKFVDKRWSVR